MIKALFVSFAILIVGLQSFTGVDIIAGIINVAVSVIGGGA